MCVDSDLFGEVIVTYDDVELWLRAIPRHVDGQRENQVQDYVENYNVVNKIREAKLNNSFYSLNDNLPLDKQNLSQILKNLLKPKFKTLPILPRSMIRA